MRKHELLKEEQEDIVLEGKASVVAWGWGRMRRVPRKLG